MKVFITGIGGMLGSAIALHHEAEDDEVYGCDIDPNPNLGWNYETIDVRDFPGMSYALNKVRPHRVYHCAAMLGVKNTEDHPEICREINEDGTIATFHAARTAKVKQFVFLSSSEVYGDPRSTQRIHETDDLCGTNVYARSKIRGEEYIRDYKQSTMDVLVARMFNCYGLYQTKQFVIPKWVDAANTHGLLHVYGSLQNTRSYLYSEDAAKMLKAYADRAEHGSIVNVGSAGAFPLGFVAELIIEMSGNDMADVVLHANHYEDRSVDRDIPNRLPNTTRLLQYHGGNLTPLRAGLKLMNDNRHTLRDDWTYPRTEVTARV